MGNTKKVGSTGRFGSRYGVGIRKKLLKIEPRQKEKQICINCGSNSLKRKSKGIFECNKCGYRFVGGAYLPKTLSGGIILQMISQKQFTPESLGKLTKKEEEVKEEAKEEEGDE